MSIIPKFSFDRWVLLFALCALTFGLIVAGLRSCAEVPTTSGEEVPDKHLEKEDVPAIQAAETHIKGQVYDSKARPVAGAEVKVFCGMPTGLHSYGITKTDKEGSYTRRVCNAGVVHVLVTKKGLERGHLVFKIPIPQKDDKREFSMEHVHLQPGVTLSGSVADTRGFPIKGALVAAFPLEQEKEKEKEIEIEEEKEEEAEKEAEKEKEKEKEEEKKRAKGEETVEAKGKKTPLVTGAGGTVSKMGGVRLSWPYVARADKEGRFEIIGLRPGRYRVRFRAKGYLETVRESEQVPGPWLDVSMESLKGVSGSVFFKNKPVSGAEVTVAGSGLWPARRGWTDSKGKFRFADIPPGVYEMRARKDDLASRVIMGLEVEEGVDVDPVRLNLEEGIRVRFMVKNRASGEPLAMARVMLGHGALTVAARSGRTDEDGVIEFRGVLPGRYFVSAESFGFLPQVSEPLRVEKELPAEEEGEDENGDETSEETKEETKEESADIEEKGEGGGEEDDQDRDAMGDKRQNAKKTVEPTYVQEVLIELRPGAELAGKVVDDVGEVVEGARLEIISSSRGVRGGRLSAGIIESREEFFQMGMDPVGRGSVHEGLNKLSSLTWGAVSADRDPAKSVRGRTEDGVGDEGVVFEVPDFVMAPDGAAVREGGSMSLGVTSGPVPLTPLSGGWHEQSEEGESSWTAPGGGPAHLHIRKGSYITDSKGEFRITGLASGDVVIVISHPDYARYQSKPMRLRLNHKRDGLRFVLSPGIKLLGTVVDEIENPLQGVRVVASGAGDAYHGAVAVSDKKGEFVLNHLAGKVRLQFTSPGYLALVSTVDMSAGAKAGGEKRLSVTLEKASGRLSGYVVDSRDLPISDGAVEAISLNPRSPQRVVSRTGQEGEFLLEGLGNLDYLVRVYHADRPMVEYRGLELNRSHRLVMGYGGGIQGWVRDKQTRGYVADLKIVLKPKAGPSLERRFSNGVFSWSGIAAGVYDVSVSAPGYAPLSKRVKVPEGEAPRQITIRDLEWWMELSGSLRGIVRDRMKFPVEGAEVWCEGVKHSGKEGSVKSGRDGGFSLEDLPSGSCNLHALHPDKGAAALTGVKVVPGREARDLVLELSREAGQGEKPKAPIAGVGVTLRERGESVFIASVKRDSTAAGAGLAVGDELVKVDGESLEGLDLVVIKAAMRGPVGTTVIFTVVRGGKRLSVPVRREIVE